MADNDNDQRGGIAGAPVKAAEPANNARYGLILFALYCLLYGGFMGLNVYDPKLMASTPFAGVNTAILYGFGLILAALVLAGIYMYLCHGQVEDEGSHE